MGRFNRYLGKFEIKIDDEELELEVGIGDIAEWMSIQRKYAGKSRKMLEGLAELFEKIIKRSYPEEPEEEVKAFVSKKAITLLTELTIAFGWSSREGLEKSFREAQKTLEIGEESETTESSDTTTT